jgi:hypothetical protein
MKITVMNPISADAPRAVTASGRLDRTREHAG